MDYTQCQNQRRCNMIPLSPAQTPRSSLRASRDSLFMDGNLSAKYDKDVNVQVVLCCRPLNEDEMQRKSPAVILCNELKGVVSVIQNTAHKQIDRTFLFDKVFGATCEQKELFDSVVLPIVNEVLEGYNCTIFAYGQTGTGKTYTMEGGRVAKGEEFLSDVGIIPRAVEQIFDVLEARNDDYSVKVTFLELYNEEIMDLLAPEESLNSLDDKSRKPIALMEDGRGGVFIRGLEQEVVYTAHEIYCILGKGSVKKRTADTLLNKQSNRSHTIFSITIHIKESSSEGEELIKCRKLNLVDLAGSENILRSGAREERAREAGEINKSLLTVGRVINAHVEHSGHVPYRDSKLTRLLRDSLGGKTKTCIIATISPSIHSLEETLSTLDYAHRAKNIKNRPEVNQRMIKSEMLKDLYTEIDRLRQEVHATREKNGIYIPQNHYLNEEAERKAMAEKMKNMEIDLEFKDEQIMELQKLYNNQQQLITELSEKLQGKQKEFEQTQDSLFDLEGRYRNAHETIKEKEYLISNLLQSEKALTKQALALQVELENVESEAFSLFAKIEQKDKLEEGNKLLVQNCQSQLAQHLEILHETIASSVRQQEKKLRAIEEDLHSFLSKKAEAAEELLTQVGKLKDMYCSGIKSLDDVAGEFDGSYQLAFSNVTSELSRSSFCLVDLLEEKFLEINAILDDVQSDISSQEEKLAQYVQQQREGHSRTLQMTRSISEIMMKFFETFVILMLSLTQIVEESQKTNGQKLLELEKEFEECAAYEKRQLLESVAELLDGSNARKRTLVQTAINGLLESTASKTCKLQQELSKLQDFSCSVKGEWASYMEATEINYVGATAAIENGKDGLEKGLQQSAIKARMSTTILSNAQESILGLQKRNVDSVDSIARDGKEATHMIHTNFSSVALSALEEADIASKALLSFIENSLTVDHDAHKSINLIIAPTFEDMKGMRSNHYVAVQTIKEHAGQCLVNEYKVDEPYCLMLKNRPYSVKSTASIEELRTHTCEESLKKVSGDASINQQSGDLSGAYESTHSSNNSRVPLASVN